MKPPNEIAFWRAWVQRCEREALRCEAEAVRWRTEKAPYARQKLNEAENAGTLLEPLASPSIQYTARPVEPENAA